MKKYLFISLILFFCNQGFAQDPHFSQYYASQSMVNPATTGMFTGDMKLSGLYRQQWPQYGNSFVTGIMSVEWKPRGFKDGENPNRLAFGSTMMFDRTPDEVLKSHYASVLIAYHKALDEKGNNKLGIGFMAVYNQKMLDASQLTFASQFQSGGFSPQGGEVIASNRTSSFDVNTGLLYSYEDDDKLIYTGVSVYHLMQPESYFIQQNQLMNFMPRRYNFNAGMNIRSNNFQIASSVLWMRQQNVNEIMIGGMIGIPFSEEEGNILYAGSWYRVGEALIPTINLQWKTMNLGLSYDADIISNSSLTKPRSFELSISYRIAPYRDNKTGCFAF
ncbi:MAG: PorP/SprF family type IX secretion system membrane protein [Flavisolibacter sp.]